jgi:hypothetical protein
MYNVLLYEKVFKYFIKISDEYFLSFVPILNCAYITQNHGFGLLDIKL